MSLHRLRPTWAQPSIVELAKAFEERPRGCYGQEQQRGCLRLHRAVYLGRRRWASDLVRVLRVACHPRLKHRQQLLVAQRMQTSSIVVITAQLLVPCLVQMVALQSIGSTKRALHRPCIPSVPHEPHGLFQIQSKLIFSEYLWIRMLHGGTLLARTVYLRR